MQPWYAKKNITKSTNSSVYLHISANLKLEIHASHINYTNYSKQISIYHSVFPNYIIYRDPLLLVVKWQTLFIHPDKNITAELCCASAQISLGLRRPVTGRYNCGTWGATRCHLHLCRQFQPSTQGIITQSHNQAKSYKFQTSMTLNQYDIKQNASALGGEPRLCATEAKG